MLFVFIMIKLVFLYAVSCFIVHKPLCRLAVFLIFAHGICIVLWMLMR